MLLSRFVGLTLRRGKACLIGALGALALMSLGPCAQAEPIHIVALGASNTSGYAVGAAAAWPAQLQSMLKAKGYDVTMSVNGVVGDTSAGILNRVDSAVASGTQVVVFDVGAGNDKDTGATTQTAANVAQIEQRIRARGAKPVFAAYAKIVGTEQSNPSAWITGDAHHHLTPQSHARVAAALLPQVIAAIGKKP